MRLNLISLSCNYLLNMDMGDDTESQHFAVHTIFKDKCFGMHNLERRDFDTEDAPKKVCDQYPQLKFINPYLSKDYKNYITFIRIFVTRLIQYKIMSIINKLSLHI